MDNKLNLTVQFNGIDKLSPGLRNIIGLGKSSAEAMRDITREGGKARSELGRMEKDLSILNKQLIEVRDQISIPGGKNGLALIEQELSAAIAETNVKLAEQRALIERNTVARERQARVLAIDGDVARIRGAGHSMVSSGMGTLMFAGMAMAPFYEIAHSAGAAQNLENRLRIMGLDNATVRALETNAKRAQVAGASYLDMLRYTVEAQGAFRESGEGTLAQRISGARTMVPILARMSFAAKAMGMEVPEEQERYLLRFIEQAGGMNDPHRAASIADGVFRALQSSGGTVQASDYQQFMAAAGTAGMKLSQRAMFADFEPLIGELHAGAGVGLMSAYLRVNGVGRMLRQPAAEMRRLGLWTGGRNGMSDANTALFAGDPVEFYRNVILPAYAKAHINDPQRENALVFGRTGGMLFNLIDKQMNAIMRSREAYAQSQGINPAYQQAKDSFFGQKGQMTAAWQDFLVVAGSKGGVLEMLVGAMRSATGALRALTAFGNAHPTAFRWIATALTWSIGLKLAWAAGKIALGGFLQPAGSLWGIFRKLKEGAAFAEVFPKMGWAIEKLRGPIGTLSTLVFKLGRQFGVAAAKYGVLAAEFVVGKWAAITSAIGAARTAFIAFDVAAMMNPFGWVIGAIAAVTALGLALWHYRKPIYEWFHQPGPARNGGSLNGAPAVGAHGVRIGKVEVHVHQRPGEDAHALAHRVAKIVTDGRRHARLASYQDDF